MTYHYQHKKKIAALADVIIIVTAGQRYMHFAMKSAVLLCRTHRAHRALVARHMHQVWRHKSHDDTR